MKWKVLFGALCIILIGSRVYAQEETYIVQFNNKVQVLTTESGQRHESRNYTTATLEELQEYIDAGIVEYYEPDYQVELLETFNSGETTETQWNLEAIKINKAWNIGCLGNDVVVGVIDSGCYAHPDILDNLLVGRNYTSADLKNTDDAIGHGTYVSGIIAAECNGKYIDGISHRAKIVPLKCFDNGVITQTSMISDAIYDAIDLYDCDVINLSLGIPKSKITKTLENAIKYAIKNGCIVVAAVGNDGGTTEYYPAKYDREFGLRFKNNAINLFLPKIDINTDTKKFIGEELGIILYKLLSERFTPEYLRHEMNRYIGESRNREEPTKELFKEYFYQVVLYKERKPGIYLEIDDHMRRIFVLEFFKRIIREYLDKQEGKSSVRNGRVFT